VKLPDRLVWVDLETTGLDPEKDLILEAALVITDNLLQERSTLSLAVKPAGGLPPLHPVVLDMHSKNGLLGELYKGQPIAKVDVVLSSLVICEHAMGGPICGASAHFDMGFLRKHMPLLAGCFNHRVFDTSTLKMAELIRNGKVDDGGHDPAHRALDDCRDSIQVARTLLRLSEGEAA
jgi:oligoribonuclease